MGLPRDHRLHSHLGIWVPTLFYRFPAFFGHSTIFIIWTPKIHIGITLGSLVVVFEHIARGICRRLSRRLLRRFREIMFQRALDLSPRSSRRSCLFLFKSRKTGNSVIIPAYVNLCISFSIRPWTYRTSYTHSDSVRSQFPQTGFRRSHSTLSSRLREPEE